MIEELNKKLKSMYLEPRTKLRVDVDYVIGRLEEIVNSDHTDVEEFLEELKQNMENHNGWCFKWQRTREIDWVR